MKSGKQFLQGALASIALMAIARRWSGTLALMDRALQRYRKGRKLRKRLNRAEKANANPGLTASELALFGLASLICAVFGVGFMIAGPEAQARDDQIYAFALSLAFFFNVTLFLARFSDYAGALSDIARIGDFKRALSDPPNLPSRRTATSKYRPANDDD